MKLKELTKLQTKNHNRKKKEFKKKRLAANWYPCWH